MADVGGATIIAASLKQLGVQHIFGIVGIPVVEVAEACIQEGIRMITFRNEQSAVYAASIYGYLTGLPGVCLVVGGPGVVHALAGVENSNANRFPMLLLAGSAETHLRGLGAFQQLDQTSLVKAAGAKFAEQPSSLDSLPRLLEQAYKISFYGKPGTSYIDLPADLIQSKLKSPLGPERRLLPPASPPRTMADPQRISAAALTLKEAKFPLLIVGKGCAQGRTEEAVRGFQADANLSFIPTPMGKGVISDLNTLNFSAARSAALNSADVILVLGARLNWILHLGASPKFRKDVKIIHVDQIGEELHGSTFGSRYLGVQGDIGHVVTQLKAALEGWHAPPVLGPVVEKKQQNETKALSTENAKGDALQYQPVYKVIRELLEQNAKGPVIFVSEGANTMDISRTSFKLTSPRTRLDAGTNATMGVGMGYAISAKVANPASTVIAIEGDSAFGFSAMELETAVRSNLPMIIYVMNNSGVYHGTDPSLYSRENGRQLPSTALSLQTEYHMLARSLGGLGFCATTLEEVRDATIEALHSNQVALINVIIDPAKEKELKFGWMVSAKL